MTMLKIKASMTQLDKKMKALMTAIEKMKRARQEVHRMLKNKTMVQMMLRTMT